MLVDINNDRKKNMISKQSSQKNSDPFPFILVMTIALSIVIVIVIVGLTATRFYSYFNRRKKQSKDLSYSISRYWRRQFASVSFDSINQSPPLSNNNNNNNNNNSQTNQETNEVTRIIKSSFSWPEATLINQQKQQHEKDEFSSTISSLSNSSTMEHINEPASLIFSLRWNEINGSLFVRVINAQNLFVYRRHRQPTLIDSYVRVELISTENDNTQEPFQSMRTHIIKKTNNPVYDELFEFSNIRQINNTNELSLLFTILTYDTFTRDEILGQVMFPIILPDGNTPNALEPSEVTFTQDITPRHKQLCNQQLGQMLISLCYQPIDSTITLIVLKASNLPRISTTRLINPYFKIYMFYKGQRIIKKRSTIKRSTQCPVYNECFTFHIPDNDLQNIHFDIILFDYDSHMKHEPIGTFSIGNNTNEINQHWNDVCHRQITKQIAQWYQLKPFNILNY
ncbi:unnamed protein product [Rotaria sordida]|uniref:C2 domain-containing protein n=1 Tax=Rotaria sordida TaxID=392033 RepID=A0A813WX02_9BILA|nr:unnamed protein product [Rotaria sordida]CAF0928118.1 unnamed protein product [Rotaria sordida]